MTYTVAVVDWTEAVETSFDIKAGYSGVKMCTHGQLITRREIVYDVNMIREHGIHVIRFKSIGCTSREQAGRIGRWMLATQGIWKETKKQ